MQPPNLPIGPGIHINAVLDGLRVLVVDDDPDSRELLGVLLRRCGADVLECESAAAAIAALDSASVNLLVADLGMADVDGYGLIAHVRQIGNGHRQVPAVAVSAYTRPEDRRKALAAGYNSHCPKPVDSQEFLRIVAGVLRLTG